MSFLRSASALMVQYAHYHRDRRNIATHLLGVPLIFMAIGIMLTQPTWVWGGWTLSAAWCLWGLTSLWYLTRGTVLLGVATTVVNGLLIACAHGLVPLVASAGLLAWQAGLALFVIGWIIQFVGHYFEGKKPAFADDNHRPLYGKRVLVTGCGPIGALLIAGLRRAGAARIVAVDLADGPLACARAMGADETVNLITQPEGLAAYAANKGTFDVMFEASGSDKALRSGLDVVTPCGVIVTIGLGGDSTLPLNQLVSKELELRGTFRFHPEFAVAVRFLNEGLINGKPVISHVIKLDQAESAFRLAADKSQAMKVQINFGADKVAS